MVHALMYQMQKGLEGRLVHDATGLHCCTDFKSVPYLGGVRHQMCPVCDNLCGWSVIISHHIRLMVA